MRVLSAALAMLILVIFAVSSSPVTPAAASDDVAIVASGPTLPPDDYDCPTEAPCTPKFSDRQLTFGQV